MAARASTDRGVGRLASRRTVDREKTKPGCLTARARGLNILWRLQCLAVKFQNFGRLFHKENPDARTY